jgi:hypothetical protein
MDLAVLTIFRIYESAYVTNQRGLMAEDEWDRFRRALCDHYFRAQRNGPEALDMLSGSMTSGFMLFMSQNCTE